VKINRIRAIFTEIQWIFTDFLRLSESYLTQNISEKYCQDQRIVKILFCGKISLDRESIASQYMDIHTNPRISKWISIETQVYPNGYLHPKQNILETRGKAL